jgi:hypothetical protein
MGGRPVINSWDLRKVMPQTYIHHGKNQDAHRFAGMPSWWVIIDGEWSPVQQRFPGHHEDGSGAWDQGFKTWDEAVAWASTKGVGREGWKTPKGRYLAGDWYPAETRFRDDLRDRRGAKLKWSPGGRPCAWGECQAAVAPGKDHCPPHAAHERRRVEREEKRQVAIAERAEKRQRDGETEQASRDVAERFNEMFPSHLEGAAIGHRSTVVVDSERLSAVLRYLEYRGLSEGEA